MLNPPQPGVRASHNATPFWSPDLPQKAITVFAPSAPFNGLHHADQRAVSIVWRIPPCSSRSDGTAVQQRSTATNPTAASLHRPQAHVWSAEHPSATAPPVVRIEGLWHGPRAVPLSCQNGQGLTGNCGTPRHSAPDARETAKPLVTRAPAQPRSSSGCRRFKSCRGTSARPRTDHGPGPLTSTSDINEDGHSQPAAA